MWVDECLKAVVVLQKNGGPAARGMGGRAVKPGPLSEKTRKSGVDSLIIGLLSYNVKSFLHEISARLCYFTYMKFSTLMRHMKAHVGNDTADAVKRADRRTVDVSICEIDGTVYPVTNWSASGILLAGDERLFAKGETIDLKLRFRLSDRILEIPHTATVVRKIKGGVALHFDPLPDEARRDFTAVVDDYDAQATA